MKTCLLALSFSLALCATASQAGDSGLKVINSLTVGGDGGWDYVTVDAVNRRLFVAHKTSIASVDLAGGTVNSHFAGADGAHIALPVNEGADVLITHGKADKVTINDAVTGAVKATIATDGKPDAAVFDAFTGKVFVMANGGNAVDVVDLGSNSVVAKIPAGGAAESGASDGAGLVFTHLEDKNAIVVIDAATMKVKATYAMDDCQEPSGLAFIPDGRLILSACKNGIARISNADTGAEVATVAIGDRPDAALYDAKAHLGYVPTADGKLTVIGFDGAPHVVDVVATKAGARTAALDTTTGDIYLPTADFGPVDPATGKPSIVSGSFEIVVVGK